MLKNEILKIEEMKISPEKKKLLLNFFELFPGMTQVPDEVYQLSLLLIDWVRAKNAQK